tara:strand:+ start:785 stop:1660 length:876 start_codon:yes stop_codon:yes gene_type:complete
MLITYFVYKTNLDVIKDYLNSLDIFYKYIKVEELNKYYNNKDLFILGQMWFWDIEYRQNIMFLNVEMLTESLRCDHIIQMIKKNIPIIDYSLTNIEIMKLKIKEFNLDYNESNLIHLPYQYNYNEDQIIKNKTNEYDYDIGIINAFIEVSDTNSSKLEYRRNKIWELVKNEDWNYINILGWGDERDKIIKKCKIILNVHNFDVFKVFEHIRCDRLIFANKIIISDLSLNSNNLDIYPCIIWKKFEDIIPTAKYILDNFNTFNNKIELQKSYKDAIINNRKMILNNFIDKFN